MAALQVTVFSVNVIDFQLLKTDNAIFGKCIQGKVLSRQIAAYHWIDLPIIYLSKIFFSGPLCF